MNAREQTSEDASLNAEHPWLGLVSFTEGLSSYFHGREEEVAELARRVQRKTLTILFGQSGLGKTSILNAGVVPRLRGQGFCPVYVRIDYADAAPSPSEQIKQAILRETRAHGQWTQVGIATEGESLWEFLHHRDDVLQDADGKPVLPLLIFDQFEELFTLAQADESGRAKAALFVADLADLVENRAPKALEARMLEDDAVAEAFDFSRNDYRVLIALREDYLAPLEGLKSQMPSITQNRMRLAPMTGTQAMAAVRGPGGHLVSEEVAAAIVRFVAGGAELANAEVEPSLLSLICKELNDARLEKGQREISVDLLAGSHAAILSDFYERALADQPASLRAFIEDVLLTESGYRENVAEERVRREFAAAGAAPDALPLLVNRRLLRIEERLDLRRVELTHDVLCSVVSASREARREREARERAEQELAAQQQRARDARRQLRRARRIAAVCIVLTIGALGASAYAYWSSQRAEAAEAMANASRSQAEGLLTFLLDDFYQELEPLGRLDIVLQLSQRAVDYYKNLPPELRNHDTERNYALALLRHGATLQSQNLSKESAAPLDEAYTRLQSMYDGGDHSEMTTTGLATALRVKARHAVQDGSATNGIKDAQRAVDLLRGPATAPGASRSLRLSYGQMLQFLGYTQNRAAELAPAVVNDREAQALALSLLENHTDDERAQYLFISVSPWLVESLSEAGRKDEAMQAAQEGLERANALLRVRPGHRSALAARAVINSYLAGIVGENMQLQRSMEYNRASITDWINITGNDPSNGSAWNNLSVGYFGLYAALNEAGRMHEAIQALAQAQEAIERTPETTFTLINLRFWYAIHALALADMGDSAGAQKSLQGLHQKGEALLASDPSPKRRAGVACLNAGTDLGLKLILDDTTGSLQPAQAALAAVRAFEIKGAGDSLRRLTCEGASGMSLVEALFRQGHLAEAEQAAATSLASYKPEFMGNFERRRDASDFGTWLALAQARQDKLDAARASLAPVLQLHQSLVAKSQEDAYERFELARATFVQALTEPAQRGALLARSLALFKALPGEMRALRSVQLWQGWAQAEQRGKAGA
ncbi:MAG: hypothetical protein JO006_20690 [Paucibacter sp.]|nr:hypothetical protein [Roseateles sp.]